MNRDETLQTATDHVNGPRQATYGDVKPSFTRTAVIWSQILGVEVDADQVALCMIGLKIARLTETPNHPDSWVDIAGYAALGGEVASDPAFGSVVRPDAIQVGTPKPVSATDSISIVLNTPTELGDEGVVDDTPKAARKAKA